MDLHILDEFSPLKKVVVCYGYSVPNYEDYSSDDPEEIKWGWENWNKDLLLKQQDIFLEDWQLMV